MASSSPNKKTSTVAISPGAAMLENLRKKVFRSPTSSPVASNVSTPILDGTECNNVTVETMGDYEKLFETDSDKSDTISIKSNPDESNANVSIDSNLDAPATTLRKSDDDISIKSNSERDNSDMLKEILVSMRRVDANMAEMRKDLSQQLNEVRGKHLKDITTIRQDIHALKDNDIKKLKETNSNQYNLIKIMSDKIDSLEDKVANQDEKIKSMEKELYTSSQQSRRINLEVQGIPDTLHDDFLKQACIEIFETTGITVKKKDIEAAHRLPSRNHLREKPVIVRFASRTKCEDILKNKKKIADFKRGDGSVLQDKRYFINNNNCRYYNSLEFYCRKLKRAGEIIGFKSSEGSLRVSLDVNTSRRITHYDDLVDLFPNFTFEDESDD